MLTGLVSVESRSPQSRRADSTREAILGAAETLFAEHGIAAVSHRQIVAAAGQGNSSVVAYHFGTKTDVVRAIEDKHGERIESLRATTISNMSAAPGLRDWVACLVLPLTDHLSALGTPSWYARFAAQVLTDPTYRRIIIKNSFESETLHHVVEEIGHALPEVPEQVLAERSVMMRTMLIYTCAEFERVLAEGNPSPWPDWPAAARGLIDGIVALMQGPAARLA